ncbi:MAG: ribosome-associated translation inhibitor RaiA [Thermodesulfovibrionales bacterium]
MNFPLQITSRNIELTDAIRTEITKKSEKLENCTDRITRCRVVVDSPHRHSHEGMLYNILIDLAVPGHEIVIKREPNEDIYVAIRDSFDAARRQLEQFVRRQRGDVKHHVDTPFGRITKLFEDRGYGFISTPDGREIYFHRNSVLKGGFPRLRTGMDVRFTEEEGEKGPQASSVVAVGA